MVVGVDEQPPEQLGLPRRQRLAAGGPEIADGQQAEHLQVLLGAERVQLRGARQRRGEPGDDLRVARVLAEGDLRHLQLVLDQELDDVAGVAVQLQPIQDGWREERGLRGVVIASSRGADGAAARGRPARASAARGASTRSGSPTGPTAEQPLEVPDRGKAVRLGALGVELGQQRAEHAARAQLLEPRRQARARAQQADQPAACSRPPSMVSADQPARLRAKRIERSGRDRERCVRAPLRTARATPSASAAARSGSSECDLAIGQHEIVADRHRDRPGSRRLAAPDGPPSRWRRAARVRSK